MVRRMTVWKMKGEGEGVEGGEEMRDEQWTLTA